MNNADVTVGWVGLSLALVVGYGAYKNKPVFGPNGIVTTAVQTGKIGAPSVPKPPGTAGAPTPPSPINPGTGPGSYGTMTPAQKNAINAYTGGPALQSAPVAPQIASGSFLSTLESLFKSLFGGTPAPLPPPTDTGGLYA